MINRKNKKSGWLLQRPLKIAIIVVLPMLILLGGALYGWQWMKDPVNSPITHIKIHATYEHYTREELQEYIKPYIKDGFFASNAVNLQQRLESMPWTKSVTLQRIWPDTLLVRLVEREPVARWGEHGLIDKDSGLFYPAIATIPQQLPVLSGPTVMAPQMLANYYKMQQILSQQDLQIAEISVSPRRSWVIQTTNGIAIELGRSEQMLRLQRLMKVWTELMANHRQGITHVDLRYANGIAAR
jgi:cell division protein FtsQ